MWQIARTFDIRPCLRVRSYKGTQNTIKIKQVL